MTTTTLTEVQNGVSKSGDDFVNALLNNQKIRYNVQYNVTTSVTFTEFNSLEQQVFFTGSQAFYRYFRVCFPNDEIIGNKKVSLYMASNRERYLPFSMITRYIGNKPRNKNQQWRTLTSEYKPQFKPKWHDPDLISKQSLQYLRKCLKEINR